MSHEKGSGESHSKVKLAAEIGLGIAATAAVSAGTVSYIKYRRQRLEAHRKLDESKAEEYERSLEIFSDLRLPQETRHILAQVAVRIYHAGDLIGDPVVNREQLRQQIANRYGGEVKSTISLNTISHLVGYLQDYNLVERRHRLTQPNSHGYAPLPALEWGLVYSATEHGFLEQAELEIASEMYYS